MVWLHRLFEIPAVPLLAFLATISAILGLRRWINTVITQAAKVPSPGRIKGGTAAAEMLRLSQQSSIGVQEATGLFANFYDPGTQTLRLSAGGYEGTNLAALGRVVHEVGHALQDRQHAFPSRFPARQALAIAARLSLPTAILLGSVGFVLDIPSLLKAGLWTMPAIAGLIATLSFRLEQDANIRGRQALALLDTTPTPELEQVLKAAAWSDLDACLPTMKKP